MQNPNVPFINQSNQRHQYNSAVDQFTNMGQGRKHSKDKANCAICNERRERKTQRRNNGQM